MFDLISTIELTASAAVVIAGLALFWGRDAREQAWAAAVLTTWFMAVVIAGATRSLYYDGGLGVPGLGAAVLIPVLTLSMIVLGTRSGRQRVRDANLAAMNGLQAVRVLGVSFVLLYAMGRLPAPFAPVAGWGDILVGVLALPVAAMVARRRTGHGRTSLAFNILGLLDLVAAVALGALSSPGPVRLFSSEPSSAIMTLLPWIIIPCFLVPALTVLHIATFYRLASARED